MTLKIFYERIKLSAQKILDPPSSLLNFLDDIVYSDIDNQLKMTQLTLIFEGFYRSIPYGIPLKEELNAIRMERWSKHYGVPTITFLLTYKSEIEQTRIAFVNNALLKKPWRISQLETSIFDKENDVIVNPNSAQNVTMPFSEESTGELFKTHNPSGGFTTTPCDFISQQFLNYTEKLALSGGNILEIGAAFGTASLQALARGAKVFCNDVDSDNLAVVRNRYLKKIHATPKSTTGDDAKLVLLPGSFPNELKALPKDFFDAILICRVLHFFTGDQIEKSLQQFAMHLKKGGKLFIVCETPFLKNWQYFIPEYESRISKGVKWPGEITNATDFETSGRSAALPKFVHWITKDILENALKKQSSFNVEYLSYLNRSGQFPEDLLLDGRESVGAIVVKS